MRRLVGSGLGALCGWVVLGSGAWWVSARQPDPPRIPVLVELFTSQGCISCPPADELLIRLDQEQPIPGVLVIPLSEHVEYWNGQGWRDPFSGMQFTERQRAYGEALATGQLYTPQMVVDGRMAFVGSQRQRAEEALRRAAAEPKAEVALTVDPGGAADTVRVAVTVSSIARTGARHEAELWLAVTEAGLVTEVTHGENAFRQLRHAAVVRQLEPLTTVRLPAPAPVTTTTEVGVDAGWRRHQVRVVAFLQERGSRRVLGASQIRLE